jgi:hypothetical protein
MRPAGALTILLPSIIFLIGCVIAVDDGKLSIEVACVLNIVFLFACGILSLWGEAVKNTLARRKELHRQLRELEEQEEPWDTS